jgi:flagellar biosynthetic protein FlhB
MSEESEQEKTEQPTERRKQDALEKGQLLVSKDFVMAGVLLAGAGIFAFFGRQMFQEIVGIFRYGLDITPVISRDMPLMATLGDRFVSALILVVGFSTPLIIAAVAAQFLLGGMHFIPANLAFKGSRLSPLAGLKRMFGLDALIELGKSLLKVTVLGALGVWIVLGSLPEIIALTFVELQSAVSEAGGLTIWIILVLVGAIGLLGALDAGLQWYRHNQKLMMTKQELKDEYKQTEGSPEIRARIRKAQQEIAQRGSVAEVDKAQVVLVNPQHFAVALHYDFAEGSAPKVLAKGADMIAAQIREKAEAAGVPVLRMPLLTRALYYTTDIGAEIHADLYRAVATVLSFVFQAGAEGDPPDVEVPEALRFDSNGRRAGDAK